MLKRKRNENHSLRTEFLLKKSVAEEFENEERIYYPHNLDFRGRAYPIHPHLQASSSCRFYSILFHPVQLF